MRSTSPGVDRPLKKDKDFERNIGKMVEVHTFAKINGEKEFIGELKSFDDKSFTIIIDDEVTFSKKDVSLVKLFYEFNL